MKSYFLTYINMIEMDIKYPIKNKHIKCVLQIDEFSGPRPWVRSSRRVGRVRKGGGGVAAQ